VTATREAHIAAQSPAEELANSVSHGVGLLLALAAFPVLVLGALGDGPGAVVGASVFGASLALLYLLSALYHAVPPSRAKGVLRTLDHSAIYLLIAGTYTPFTLGVLRGPWGWSLLGVIWAMAVAGIVAKAAGGLRHPRLSTALYVLMGWLILIAAWPLSQRMPAWGLFWLLAGGVAYTGGVALYAARRLPFGHFLWHLAVMAGTACHFVAVYRFAT
jgi:hemolysin III